MANRTITHYKVSIATAATALGVTDVQSVTWDGYNLVWRHTDIETPNTPLPGITKVDEKFTVTSWNDIKAQFFPGIPDSRFKRMSVLIDETYIYVALNLEDD